MPADLSKEPNLKSAFSVPPQKRYSLAETTFSSEEIEAAKAVIDSTFLSMGKRVKQFESEFAVWTGSKFALMVNSGSSANLLMVDALLRRSQGNAPLKAGDEVLVPALAWPTTVWPLVQLGLKPVFVDIDPQTMAIDLQSAKESLGPKTRGMFLIHVLGQSADMSSVMAFCNENDLVLLEDVCESLGSHHNGQHAGTFGMMGSFSCYFSHHISTIEGGVIITSDEALYNDLQSLRAHGWIRNRSDKEDWAKRFPDLDPRFMFIMGGYNVRPTEIQGVIGSIQLRKLDDMLAARERLARSVQGLILKYTPWMKLVGSEHLAQTKEPIKRRARSHSWMTLSFILEDEAPLSARQTQMLFEKMGIETRPIIAGNLARHPASKRYDIREAPSLKNADHVLHNGFMIGCHPTHWKENVDLLETAFFQASKH